MSNITIDYLLANVPKTLRPKAEEFIKKAFAYCEEIAKEINKKSPPALIYHYTNDKGLKGILESGKLHFTDIFNLNDPSEIKHGVQHLHKALEGMSNKYNGTHELFYKDFKKIYSLKNVESTASFFIFCCSDNRDELGQWRAYADDGRGYALGFDRTILEKNLAKPEPKSFWIDYNDKKLAEKQRTLVEIALPYISHINELKHMSEEEKEKYINALLIILALSGSQASLTHKHEAYKNESEYRFLRIFPANSSIKEVKIKMRPYSLVRYIEIDWKSVDPAALKEIVIGPSANLGVASDFAYSCIREYSSASNSISINQSAIPYKSLTNNF